MGEFANVKYKKLLKVIKKIVKRNADHLELVKGGNHTYVLKSTFWKRPFPIPCRNSEVNKNIISALAKQLDEHGYCTIKDFKELL